MARKPTGKPRGRSTWAKGVKLEFLKSYKDQFLENSDASAFYTSVTQAWLLKYGYDLPFEEEPPKRIPSSADVDAPTEEQAPVVDISALSPEERILEIEKRKEVYKKLRLKLSNWFRHRYNNKKTDNSGVSGILDAMSDIAVVRPRKKSALSMYTQLHYKTHLKARFDPIWERVKDTVPPETRVSMCNDFIRACWEGETEEFRKGIVDRVAEEHAKAMEIYKAKGNWDNTAEGYQQAWDTIDEVLPPLVDAIAKRMGMAVSLMLVGPVGSENGNVVLQSVHSETMNGLIPLIWPEYDEAGFSRAQESIVKYGRAFFSPQMCLERVVGLQTDEISVPGDDADDVKESFDSGGFNPQLAVGAEIDDLESATEGTDIAASFSALLHSDNDEFSWADPGMGHGFSQEPTGPGIGNTELLQHSSSAFAGPAGLSSLSWVNTIPPRLPEFGSTAIPFSGIQGYPLFNFPQDHSMTTSTPATSQPNNSAALQDILQPRPPLISPHIPFQFNETDVPSNPLQLGGTSALTVFAQTALPQAGRTGVVLPSARPQPGGSSSSPADAQMSPFPPGGTGGFPAVATKYSPQPISLSVTNQMTPPQPGITNTFPPSTAQTGEPVAAQTAPPLLGNTGATPAPTQTASQLPGPGVSITAQLAEPAPFQHNSAPSIPPPGLGTSSWVNAEQSQDNLNETPTPAPTQATLLQATAADRSRANLNGTPTMPMPTHTTSPRANAAWAGQSPASLNGMPTSDGQSQAASSQDIAAEQPQADSNGIATSLPATVAAQFKADQNGMPTTPFAAQATLPQASAAEQSQSDSSGAPMSLASAQAAPPQANTMEQPRTNSNGMPITPAFPQATLPQVNTAEQSQTPVAHPVAKGKQKQAAAKPRPAKRKRGDEGSATDSREPEGMEQGNAEGESGSEPNEVADSGSPATVPARRVSKLPAHLKDAGYKPPAKMPRKK